MVTDNRQNRHVKIHIFEHILNFVRLLKLFIFLFRDREGGSCTKLAVWSRRSTTFFGVSTKQSSRPPWKGTLRVGKGRKLLHFPFFCCFFCQLVYRVNSGIPFRAATSRHNPVFTAESVLIYVLTLGGKSVPVFIRSNHARL